MEISLNQIAKYRHLSISDLVAKGVVNHYTKHPLCIQKENLIEAGILNGTLK